MFIFAEGRGREEEEEEEGETPVNNTTFIRRKAEPKRASSSRSMDEFVLL